MPTDIAGNFYIYSNGIEKSIQMTEDFDIRASRLDCDRDFERALRPLTFDDFNGQEKIIENLRIFVQAAKMRGEALDHTLLYGPPGLGKTTLSNIMANELGVGFKVTSGPVLDKPGDLAGVLTSLEENDVLFIDEIHRLNPVVEEYLYSAMEDYRIDIMIDKGPGARSVQLNLSPFTLIGATTRSGLLTPPLRLETCHIVISIDASHLRPLRTALPPRVRGSCRSGRRALLRTPCRFPRGVRSMQAAGKTAAHRTGPQGKS